MSLSLSGELPLVHIAETAEDGSALGFYALILSDRTVRFIEHGEQTGISLPIAAFWRMVAQLEEAGYRDGRKVAPGGESAARIGRPRGSGVRDAARAWVLARTVPFHGRDCAEAIGAPQGSVGVYLGEMVREGLLESNHRCYQKCDPSTSAPGTAGPNAASAGRATEGVR